MNVQLHTMIADPLNDVLVDGYKSGRQALADRRRLQKENTMVTHRRAIIHYMRGTVGNRHASEAAVGLRPHDPRPYAA